ncbi:MAG: hypothetical protein DHS20C01_25870 [marine bacterium B5-7]|nr:MAG: hypothetical protein DHS20C01_25870 [marine bacterium B5-7]
MLSATASSMAKSQIDATLVQELLAGRTAEFESVPNTDSTRQWPMSVVYHDANGRIAVARKAGEQALMGTWWIEDDGAYCYRLVADERSRCFMLDINGTSVSIRSLADDDVYRIARFIPGDAYRLLNGEATNDVGCDCRITERRKPRLQIR